MGMSDSIARMMHNPTPGGPVDDILRPGDEDNPLLERGLRHRAHG